MTKPKSIGAYRDCCDIMDIALERKSIVVDFDTYGAAIHFRQRCYRARRILQDASRPAPGQLPFSIYDELEIIVPPKSEVTEGAPTPLTLQSRSERTLDLLTRIRTAEGEPIEVKPENPDAALAALRGKLGLE